MIVKIQHVSIGHYSMLLPLEIDLEHEDLVLVLTNRATEPMQERRVHIDLKAAVERGMLECGCKPQRRT